MPEHPSFHISSPFLRLKEFRLLLMFVSFRFIVSLFFSITVLTATAIPGAHPRSTHASIPQLFPSSPHILPQPENTTAVDAILPTCFTQPTERYAPEFLPIKISDCLLVFYAILSDPSAITPSHHPSGTRKFANSPSGITSGPVPSASLPSIARRGIYFRSFWSHMRRRWW